MARKRMIDPGFWIDEKLGTVSPFVRLLFMGLISNADDEGRLPGHPALIKSQIFPYDVDITVQLVDEWLNQLQELGIITIYTMDNQTYIQIKNFLKHQTINRPTKSKYPAPPEPSLTLQVDEKDEKISKNDSSSNTHGGLTDDSLPKEEKGREENRKRIEEEEENRKASSSAPIIDLGFQSIVKTFSENIHPITPIEAEKLQSWLDDVDTDVINAAISEAVKYNKRSYSYIEAVLNAWHNQNIKTKEGLQAYMWDKKNEKGGVKDGSVSSNAAEHFKKNKSKFLYNAK